MRSMWNSASTSRTAVKAIVAIAQLPGCVIAQPREVGDLLVSAISLPQ